MILYVLGLAAYPDDLCECKCLLGTCKKPAFDNRCLYHLSNSDRSARYIEYDTDQCCKVCKNPVEENHTFCTKCTDSKFAENNI